MRAILAATTGWIVTAAITPLTIRILRALRLLDVPNDRSSHREPTPRGGGVALLVGAAAGFLLQRPVLDAALAATLAGTVVIAAVGLLDDRFGLPMWVRFIAHVLAGFGLIAAGASLGQAPLPGSAAIPLGPWAAPVTLLWILVVTNGFNFMDGIDGLAGLQSVVTFAVVALVAGRADVSCAAAALAGASAAFLICNWSPARVFLGDVGSGALGFLVGALPLLGPQDRRSGTVLCVAVTLGLFLGDASYSRLRRIVRGESWFAPHREHLYQRLVSSGLSHSRVSATLGLGAALLGALVVTAQKRHAPAFVFWLILTLVGLLVVLELLLLRRRERAVAVAVDKPRAGLIG
jgi:UDP-N-acetylmuramyl pentapeptide phosphotransferase/UDP-N-acetylglucosamine-1-phosphate transferase